MKKTLSNWTKQHTASSESLTWTTVSINGEIAHFALKRARTIGSYMKSSDVYEYTCCIFSEVGRWLYKDMNCYNHEYEGC